MLRRGQINVLILTEMFNRDGLLNIYVKKVHLGLGYVDGRKL